MNIHTKLLSAISLATISVLFGIQCLAIYNTETYIRKSLDEFVQGYTNKDIDMTMRIFAPDVIANVQQVDCERTYKDIRAGILKDFSDDEVRYNYSYDIKEILCSNTMAIVRIVWILDIIDAETNKIIKTTKEVGMDIFKPYGDSWQLFRFIAYAKEKE
ncbi:MAG TPA: hypothetical protein VGW78_00555 [Candidatus Babeliales bacterium]|jgi:hypothetical protein|nr:hypothetical protein [Candidatus Babeliales bacterium]